MPIKGLKQTWTGMGSPYDLHPYRDTVTVTVAPTLTHTHTVMLTLTLALTLT